MKQFKPWTKDDLIKYDKMIQAKRGAKYMAKQLGKSVDDVKHHQLDLFTKKLTDKLDGKETKPLAGSTQMSAIEIVRADGKDIIMKELKKGSVRLGELSRLTQLSKEVVAEIVDSIIESTGLPVVLEDNGYLHIEKDFSNKAPINPIDIQKIRRNSIKIGIVSDTHLCSRYQQLSLLHSAYKDFEKNKIDFACHIGDLVDGAPSMHAGFVNELFLLTFEEQINYVVKNYPVSKSFKSYMLCGNHDRSWVKASAGEPVSMICKQRDDLIYLPQDSAMFRHAGSAPMVQLFHPDGGLPQAKSMKGQRVYMSEINKVISEATSLWRDTGGKTLLEIPQVLLIGHLHTWCYTIEGGTHVMTVPCFQSQTPYLRGKSINPYIGYVILTFHLDHENNVVGFTPEVKILNGLARKADY